MIAFCLFFPVSATLYGLFSDRHTSRLQTGMIPPRSLTHRFLAPLNGF